MPDDSISLVLREARRRLVDEATPSSTVVSIGIGKHGCHLPKWRERRRNGITEGSIIECDGCKQRWQWFSYGDFVDWCRV